MKKLLLVFFVFWDISAQDTTDELAVFWNLEFNEIQKTWNNNGYWGEACENIDNRYNEAILLYCKKVEENSYENYNSKVKKAIKFSFENLQHSNGAMLQLGNPVHVRTSLFLYGIANVIQKHPELLEDAVISRGFEKAIKYLEKPHPFSSNHNIAAMLTFRMLYKVTCENRFREIFEKYKEINLDAFVPVTKKKGYWPESAKKWSNRLNVPYLFVQNYFLMEYLKSFKDSEIMKLYKKQIAFIIPRIDFNLAEVNVEGSNGNFKRNGIKTVPLSSFSFFSQDTVLNLINKKTANKIFIKTSLMFKARCREKPYLSNTDLYFRFGTPVIK